MSLPGGSAGPANAGPARSEQTRARYPDAEGDVLRDGVRIHYEVYGSGETTVLLLPTWSIVHSRHWKMQIPYLSRHARVITFDGRGNGRSDRPATGYAETDFAADALAVLDATGTDRAVLVSLSRGAQRALLLAAEHPDRVAGAVFIAPNVPFAAMAEGSEPDSWGAELATDQGWAKYNRHYWLRDYRGFLEFFFSEMFSEPHSTKPIEDCVAWGLETDAADADRDGARPRARRARPPQISVAGSAARSWWSRAPKTPSPESPAGSPWPRPPAATWSCSRAPAMARTCATRSR